MHFVSSLAREGIVLHKLRFIFVLAGIGGSTHVEMHFVSSLLCEVFGKHMLRFIFCTPWNGRCLVNTC